MLSFLSFPFFTLWLKKRKSACFKTKEKQPWCLEISVEQREEALPSLALPKYKSLLAANLAAGSTGRFWFICLLPSAVPSKGVEGPGGCDSRLGA